MSTIITCPMCDRSHDTSNRVTGDTILCLCGAPLPVQHGVGVERVTKLRPEVQNPLWAWLEAEVAALWLEIYRNHPDLGDTERLTEADRLYSDPPALLIETLAYAHAWDAQAEQQRNEARAAERARRIEKAAWWVREADMWPECVAFVGGEPSEFDSALQALYDALQKDQQ